MSIRGRIRALRAPMAAVAAASLAAAGLLLTSPAASAAPVSATSGSGSWAGPASWFQYIYTVAPAGTTTPAKPADCTPGIGGPLPPACTLPLTLASGTYDSAAGTATAHLGNVVWDKPGHGINLQFNDLTVEIAGSTGAIKADLASTSGTSVLPQGPQSDFTLATIDLSGVTPTSSATSVSWAGIPGTFASNIGAYIESWAGYANTAITPLSVTINYAAPATATTTTLSVAPASPQIAGTQVTLTATVSPSSAVGAVQFAVDGSNFLAPVTVSGGTASLPTTALAVGSRSLTATFVPADAAVFTGSSSAAVAYQINPAPAGTPVLTTVVATAPQTVASDPATASPVPTGTAVTLSTTVTPAAAGTIQFLDNGAPIGAPVPVAAGAASTTTTALAAGEHSLTATFAPTDPAAFNPATTSSALIYRVAPGALPTICTVNDAAAVDVTDASALWAINLYTSTWAHAVEPESDVTIFNEEIGGDVTVPSFEFRDGTGRSDGQCTVIEFDGWFSITNTRGGNGVFRFDSATLVIAADGSGALLANVTTTPPTMDSDAPPPAAVGPTRVALAVFADADVAGRSVEFTVSPDYAGTVPTGSWATGFNSAFPGSFLFALPSSVRTYWAQTSTPSSSSKPPAPLSVYYDLDPFPTATTLTVTPANPVLIGSSVQLTATVTSAFGEPDGAVEFYEDDELIGSVPLTDGTAVATAPTLSTGTANITARYVPEAESAFLASASAPYQIVVAPVVYTPSVTTSLSSVPQGQTISFTGTGFAPNEPVSGVVNSDPVSLGSALTNANGAVVFTWTVPADFAVGMHTVVLTGGLSGASAAATFEVTAAAPACVARTVSGATLNWGLKTSFVSYVTGSIANGSYTTSGVSGQFAWSGGSGTANPASALAIAGYRGSVSFTGHGGLLALTIANPTIQITGASSALLLLDVVSKDLESGVTTSRNGVAFATLALGSGGNASTADRIAYNGVPATLTAGGATVFAGFYGAGTALDAVSFVLPLGAETPCAAAVNPASLAATGASVPAKGVLAVLLLSVGAGLVLVARRRTV